MGPVHLRPTAPLAPRVLLPGDPGRALLLAQELLEGPRMFNHHRGLWGYTGPAADGEPLTIQSTGMGGPSTAIVVEELVALGARRLIRTGTCGALDPELALGELLWVAQAIAEDGSSRCLGADGAAAARLGGHEPGDRVVSTDLFYSSGPEAEAAARERWRAAGARAVEMECATLFTVAALRGVDAGAVLAVSDLLAGAEGRTRLGEDELEDAGRRLGRAALAAL